MALNINGTTGISGVDGSNSAPALQGTDSNTGISFGSDILAFNVGGSEKGRFHSNGNFGVNSTNPQTQFVVQETDGGTGIEFSMGASESYVQCYSRSANDYKDLSLSAENLKFRVNANTEVLRIDSNGDFRFGYFTSDPHTNNGGTSAAVKMNYGTDPANYAIDAQSDSIVMIANKTGGNGVALEVKQDATVVGSISTTASSTSYNTNSDYRLKENVSNITDGITRVKQLIPRRFNWISDETNTLQDGFLAHEAQTVVPESVVGQKDQVADASYKSHSGISEGDPVYQEMDHSKLIPLLTAALQEAVAKIEVLETKVAALEAA